MTSDTAFVWVWLPEATEPVVAGRLDQQGAVTAFTYGRSYLANPDAISLYEPELPLSAGEHLPISGEIAGCIADAGPDAWGRRVIEHGRSTQAQESSAIDYLLASGSNRIGALDFQRSASDYLPRSADPPNLDELATAADAIEHGAYLNPEISTALLHGSSVGGARPKVLLSGETGDRIAKFSSTTDSFPVIKAEFVAMRLAHLAGLDVALVQLTSAIGKDVLLVDRFDRSRTGTRQLMVSALTVLELHDADGMAGRYATYADLADQIRKRFTKPDATLHELFGRIAFNILVSNTDDHARNHAAFWDGHALTLTPAYDVCPQRRTGGEAAQAMAFGRNGERLSQIKQLIDHAAVYHLDPHQAADIAQRQIATIEDNWDDVATEAELAPVDRDRLWGRQFLNPYALE